MVSRQGLTLSTASLVTIQHLCLLICVLDDVHGRRCLLPSIQVLRQNYLPKYM